MGTHDVKGSAAGGERRAIQAALLDDLAALEAMLAADAFDDGPPKLGAEQEMFLVDAAQAPAPVGPALLASAADPRLVAELGRFNLEANLSPRPLTGACLAELHAELDAVIAVARTHARKVGAEVVLCGILPTLRREHLGKEQLSPGPRYRALDDALTRARGGDFQVRLRGLDDLELTHDNVMLEACNTSFQLHLQVAPRDFARLYNLAQAITGPLLAVAANAPLFLGRRLWDETRVALFEGAVDERSATHKERGRLARVTFGSGWVASSALELFREDVARFRVLLAADAGEPSTAVLARGGVPKLAALGLHAGTVYRWNRVCYGAGAGAGAAGARPHLRIEHRALPAGPSVVDEVANAALFYGLLLALPAALPGLEDRLPFNDARANLLAAARSGLRAQLAWVDGRSVPAAALLLDELLPLARSGLASAGVDGGDVERYLGVVEARARAGRTGAQWMLGSASAMGDGVPPDARDQAIVKALLLRQEEGGPVHGWQLASAPAPGGDPGALTRVGQVMSTDLYTLGADDLVALAEAVMAWRGIGHLPVEDDQGALLGVVSRAALARLPPASPETNGGAAPAVRDVMEAWPVTVTPATSTDEARALLDRHGVGCLPVVADDHRLVGIVTRRDLPPSASPPPPARPLSA